MNRIRHLIWIAAILLAACQAKVENHTIASLRQMQVEIKEEKIEGGLDKAMRGYQGFLEATGDSPLTPEAIRRLADLKIEKEYGALTEGPPPHGSKTDLSVRPAVAGAAAPAPKLQQPRVRSPLTDAARKASEVFRPGETGGRQSESEADFELRAAASQLPAADTSERPPEGGADLERAGAREAIALYSKLLNEYPLYRRNDEVLYQMSRAYEELGETEAAMEIMERVVHEFSGSRYIDEVQFRRAEHFFAHRRFRNAEDAYGSIVTMGVGSSYYELALYKLGWTFYKQELYEEALHRFIALLDHKVAAGYDFAQTADEQERKRTEDTFRVVSLSFSNLGGPPSLVEYFSSRGPRSYEDSVYRNLAEFYFDKRRYADACSTYNGFVSRNPFHKLSPNFQMRVIEIHAAGGFPSLVLDAKKQFASTYGLQAEYWKHFEPEERPDVVAYLKTNLTDLANHYHAGYQDPRQTDVKAANFKEAQHWYREFLSSFPADSQSPAINGQLADLLMENKFFAAAAVEYEQTAYGYPLHEKSSQSGYAAVLAHREHLNTAAPPDKDAAKRDAVRSSLLFADTFPEHEKAAVVLGAAADDLYAMEAYAEALGAASKLVTQFADAETDIRRAAWLVAAHSSYELSAYSDAEAAYVKVLALLPADDPSRDNLLDNLAASIYKQGEQARSDEDYRAAADHFLRVGRMAPHSKIRPSAEYDAAAALIQLKEWNSASTVLSGFRRSFPEHALQPEITKKLAYVYREDGRFSLAAAEYERIETESSDDDIRREALLTAGELHEKAGDRPQALLVYRRYSDYFPQPVEANLETRDKIAGILKAQDEQQAYLDELQAIVAIDAAAGSTRTPRTRYLAAHAALVLGESRYAQFLAVKLVKPLEVNLRRKRDLMKTAVEEFNHLLDYELGEMTAAATFYLAEIQAQFCSALLSSERPEDLSPPELEQYELALEEQAYPFEEKAIAIHESNLKLIPRGVYNDWIEKSLQKLAQLMPARYDKPEEPSAAVGSLEHYVFVILRPVPSPEATAGRTIEAPDGNPETHEAKQPAPTEDPGPAAESMIDESGPPAGAEPAEGSEATVSAPAVQPLPDEDPAQAAAAEDRLSRVAEEVLPAAEAR